MILYFTGTGNSRYVAQVIGRITGDEVVSINEFIKGGSKETLESSEPLVFVCPTYAWRMPKIVEDFIRNTHFLGSGKAYFVLTCGTDTGNAVHYVKKLCNETELSFEGFAEIVMPENYVAMFPTPDKEQADEIIKKADPKILEIAEYIKNYQVLPEGKAKLGDGFKSGIINHVFYRVCVSAKGFYSTDKCSGCKKCAKLCSLNNIKIVNGKPHWGKNCTHCMACIGSCPNEAIEFKNKSKGRPRYCLLSKDA